MEEIKKIAIAADHAGFELKQQLIAHLKEKGIEVVDFGAHTSESVDYPDYAHPLAGAIEKGDFELGLSVCGSGNGISMTLNKHKGIRSAICWKPVIAKLAREHNNANICSLPGRFLTFEEAKEIVDAFLRARFEGGRHQPRIDKMIDF
jgi:ribose 5-phosphate isomerase B